LLSFFVRPLRQATTKNLRNNCQQLCSEIIFSFTRCLVRENTSVTCQNFLVGIHKPITGDFDFKKISYG